MNTKRIIKGTAWGVIGFLLSPLSWWNDLFVNVPLALAFAWLVSIFYPPVFKASFIIGYWITNVLGFVLMHKGAQTLTSEKLRSYDRRSLTRDLAVSLVYTGIIGLLLRYKIVEPLPRYFLEK